MLIDHRGMHVYIVGEQRFMPGVNSITKDEWDKIKDHPHVKHLLEAEKMQVLSDREVAGVEEGESAPLHSLKEFEQKDALKVIDQTFDVDLLKSWEMDEKRKPVRIAIIAKVKKIMGSAFEKEEPEAKHFKN